MKFCASQLVCSIAALITVATGPVRGQAAPAVLEAADEDSLVQYALTHNQELRAVRSEQEVAAAGVVRASALSNPVLRGEWLHVQTPQRFGYGVGVEWAPPQPGVYGNGKQLARAQVRVVSADFRERTADLEASVRRSYAQIAAFDQELALAARSVETRVAVRKAVEQRVSRGAASGIDLSLAEVSLARGEQERGLLLLGRATEVANLEALLGLEPSRDLVLHAQAQPSVPAASLELSPEELEQRAIARRPLLQADAARADAARASASVERAKRWPWLALQARYRRFDQSAYPDDVTLGVELSLPLFDGNPGPIAAAEASERGIHDLTLAHRAGIAREVRVLRAESERRRELAEQYARAIVPLLTEHAALVKQALLGLELDLTALLAAEDLVARGGIDYLEARLAQRKAEIALSRSLGAYGLRAAEAAQ